MEPVIGSKDVTDLVVKLANDVLDQMGEEYPNLTLGFYVYSVHGEFPARYKPHPDKRQEAFFFAMLVQGGDYIQTAFNISASVAKLLQAIILFFVLGAEFFINYQLKFRRGKAKGGVKA